jgi:hypothetical protein
VELRTILVDRCAVERNGEKGDEPVFTVIDPSGHRHHGNSVIFTGPAELKYDPTGGVGSRVWIETHHKVIVEHAVDTQSVCSDLEGI